MQISSSTSSYAASSAQRMLAELIAQQTDSTGQDLPQAGATGRPSGPPPGPPPGGSSQASSQFSFNTLASLLQTQEEPSAADVAAKLIGDVDNDGDGTLSLSEIQASLESKDADSTKATSATDLASALAKLDSDGDGKLNTDELTKGLEAMHARRHQHHAEAAQTASAAGETTATS